MKSSSEDTPPSLFPAFLELFPELMTLEEVLEGLSSELSSSSDIKALVMSKAFSESAGEASRPGILCCRAVALFMKAIRMDAVEILKCTPWRHKSHVQNFDQADS